MADEVSVKKVATYKGKTIEELKQLEVREAAKFLNSRCRRTVLRHHTDVEKFIAKCNASPKRSKTHLRDMVILPQLVGCTVAVYSGQSFEDVIIIPDMIGHRLGEFVATRKRVVHGSAGIGATKSSKTAKK